MHLRTRAGFNLEQMGRGDLIYAQGPKLSGRGRLGTELADHKTWGMVFIANKTSPWVMLSNVNPGPPPITLRLTPE